ncbi:MAG TPA: DNA lyase [Thermodesulfobacteriota bacterium]|nr:DNA lyase [Thermodesulfobacteriota bacterium]
MKRLSFEKLRSSYTEKKDLIQGQLKEFKDVIEKGDDRRLFEELAFCLLTSAVGPKVGQMSLDAIKDILMKGSEKDLQRRLEGVHKYPEKASYIVRTREFLKNEFDFELKDLILSFKDPEERRDFFASNKDIKGLGYVQASHFLRNIGFSGYAILDKNVLLSLYELGVIDDPKPPTSKKKYLEIEGKMKEFAKELGIEFDELDLLLWSQRTGRIPK